MLTRKAYLDAQRRAVAMMEQAGIALTAEEKANVEVADFGLGDLERQGLEIVTYVNNDRYCAKELVLLPGQTCPEHRHVDRGTIRGKTETFRCRRGIVWLYIPGDRTGTIHANVPGVAYTVFHEIELRPGMQYTLQPNTLHWFQAGGEGAIVSEFSSPSDDASDIFTDQAIKRLPEIEA